MNMSEDIPAMSPGIDPENNLKSQLEALLLVSVDPVSVRELSSATGAPAAQIQLVLTALSQELADQSRGIQLREVAGGWRLYTHPAYHELVERYIQSWDSRKLSQAALETLAVIAYHQPATREGVRAIRGVNSDSAISSLIDKGLVREIGKREGSASKLLGTTTAFLERYGLNSLDDLPDLEQFAPDEQTRRLIRERLSGSRVQARFDDLNEDDSDDGDDDINYDAQYEGEDSE